MILRGLLMIDEVPSTKLAVYLFLEMIALGFALETVAAFARGDSIFKWVGLLALGIAFMVLGVKSSSIIDKCSHLVDWKVWGKRIAIASHVLFVASVIALMGVGYYEWRTISTDWHRLRQSLDSSAPVHEKLQSPTTRADTPPPIKNKYLDWKDKQNWRQNLHTGMSRSQVRALFGEPANMAVSGDMEFWEYGAGRITFDMELHKDGSLYSWDEPR
jgi:hypothetical protein